MAEYKNDDPYKPVFASPINGWTKWFAWYPIDTVDAGWTWLMPVYYRVCVFYSWCDGVSNTRFFQYKRRP